MRWAAFFYLGMAKPEDEQKETYGFPSQKKVPRIDLLDEFSGEVTNLVDQVEKKHF